MLCFVLLCWYTTSPLFRNLHSFWRHPPHTHTIVWLLYSVCWWLQSSKIQVSSCLLPHLCQDCRFIGNSARLTGWGRLRWEGKKAAQVPATFFFQAVCFSTNKNRLAKEGIFHRWLRMVRWEQVWQGSCQMEEPERSKQINISQRGVARIWCIAVQFSETLTHTLSLVIKYLRKIQAVPAQYFMTEFSV